MDSSKINLDSTYEIQEKVQKNIDYERILDELLDQNEKSCILMNQPSIYNHFNENEEEDEQKFREQLLNTIE